jgi:hypothetical protein
VLADACAALTYFNPDPGFESRWTRRERINQDKVNAWIVAHCY